MDKSILEVVHDSAKGLHDSGIMDPVTMREFDALCLPEVNVLSAKQIKAIRLKEKVSQDVFALYLNASSSTVKKWEQGLKKPRGVSLKILDLISRKGLSVLI